MSYYLKYKNDTARNVKFVNISKQPTPRLSASTLSEPYRALQPNLTTFEDVVRVKKEKKESPKVKRSSGISKFLQKVCVKHCPISFFISCFVYFK